MCYPHDTAAGALVFEPASITIAKGESVTFVNNAGFPHNVVFDEDAVPVSAGAAACRRSCICCCSCFCCCLRIGAILSSIVAQQETQQGAVDKELQRRVPIPAKQLAAGDAAAAGNQETMPATPAQPSSLPATFLS